MAHGINILNGGAVPVIAMQMVGTTFMAIYFVALFMRTGSIIVPILVHSIWDFICVATEDTVAENLLMVQPTVDLFLVGSILTCIALGIVGIVLINKGSDSIKRIWDEKWTD
jgi:membrane protease YdiL (CAAX protease family)